MYDSNICLDEKQKHYYDELYGLIRDTLDEISEVEYWFADLFVSDIDYSEDVFYVCYEGNIEEQALDEMFYMCGITVECTKN